MGGGFCSEFILIYAPSSPTELNLKNLLWFVNPFYECKSLNQITPKTPLTKLEEMKHKHKLKSSLKFSKMRFRKDLTEASKFIPNNYGHQISGDVGLSNDLTLYRKSGGFQDLA